MNAPGFPRLSVVLPNYNHARELPRCLHSLFSQSAPPYEVIAVDDASTDHSLEVLGEYARRHPNLRVFRNEKNQRVVYGMNRGLSLAEGDYVFFIGADDEVLPGLFEKSLRLLAGHPQAALCCTIAEWREPDGEEAAGRQPAPLVIHMGAGMAEKPACLSPDDLVRLGKRGKVAIVSSSCVMRVEPLRAAGGFVPELLWHTDWFACYVTGFRHGLCFLPEILSRAHINPKGFYHGRNAAEHRQVLLKLLELLNSKEYADVMPRIREAGELALFAMPLLRLLLARPEYRHFINLTLLRKTLRRSAELQAKRCFPAWLSRWCLKVFYRKPPAKAASA